MVRLSMFGILVRALNAFDDRNPLAFLRCRMTGRRVAESAGSVTTLSEVGSNGLVRKRLAAPAVAGAPWDHAPAAHTT
jgi:hypothetical protein